MSHHWIAIVKSELEKYLLLNLKNLNMSSVLGGLGWFFIVLIFLGVIRY